MNSEFPVSQVASPAEKGMRDLMGLLALPALWAGKSEQAILRTLMEAVERIFPIRVAFANVPVTSADAAPIFNVRVDGGMLHGEALIGWQLKAMQWPAGPEVSTSAAPMATPLGEMRFVRFRLGYHHPDSYISFGSMEATFPTNVEHAVLRAAISLAVGALQGERVRKEQEKAARAKDEFLAMLGHELRNPLAPIAAAAELLRHGNLDAQSLKRASEVISRQALHMRNLVDDLLDVSRITSGLVELEKVAIPIRTIVEDAVEQAQPLIDTRRHTLSVASPLVHGCVLGDHKRLVQVLANLLTNAAKYTPPGGRIVLATSLDKGKVTIQVTDNGLGIDQDLLPNIFDLFTQAKRTSDRAQGGLGLGLALVKKLVQLHNGSVTAYSAGQNQGSSFTVCLPTSGQERVGQAQAPVPLPSQHKRPLRVMLVDDNQDAADMTAMLLAAAGFDVTVKYGSMALLEATLDTGYDVYILDLGLPQIDGLELGRRIRRMPLAEHATFIALTGYGQDEDIRKSSAAGFHHHFVKPADIGKLAQLLTGIHASMR